MVDTSTTVDMTRGVYRWVFAGFIRGKRINQVSLPAEAWFWRLNVIADDFGNLLADPNLLAREAGGRREVSVKQSESMVRELSDARLITFYEVDGDRYINIVDFSRCQKPKKNGKRIRRVPAPPDESKEIQNNPEKSSSSGAYAFTPACTDAVTHAWPGADARSGQGVAGGVIHKPSAGPEGGSGWDEKATAAYRTLVEPPIGVEDHDTAREIALGGITRSEINAEWKRVQGDPRAKSKTGALVGILRKRVRAA